MHVTPIAMSLDSNDLSIGSVEVRAKTAACTAEQPTACD
jgi:hypothetical protein